MIYIGAVLLSCQILNNPNVDFCSYVNFSLPGNVSCNNSSYFNLIPIDLQGTSTIPDTPETYTSIQTETEKVKEQTFSETKTTNSNHLPLIITGTTIGSMLVAGGAISLVNRYRIRT
jgi:hypothetical protein